MTAHEMLAELTRLGIVVEARGDRLRYSPRAAMTPELAARVTAHKPALLAILTTEAPPAAPAAECDNDANEAHWRAIDEADRNYLLGPRCWPAPCPWCGGRLIHRPACKDLRQEWVPIIPFGKHRGRRVDELPRHYVDWILAHDIGGEAFRGQLGRWLADEHGRQRSGL